MNTKLKVVQEGKYNRRRDGQCTARRVKITSPNFFFFNFNEIRPTSEVTGPPVNF